MLEVGKFNTLKVMREVSIGVYLEGAEDGILLPKRFMPERLRKGDEIRVFVYHDSEDRLIATTEVPKAIVGQIAKLTAVSVTPQGAFLDWGLIKDLFVPKLYGVALY
jgi:predicted RNA-binding protein (virulence factor B family)